MGKQQFMIALDEMFNIDNYVFENKLKIKVFIYEYIDYIISCFLTHSCEVIGEITDILEDKYFEENNINEYISPNISDRENFSYEEEEIYNLLSKFTNTTINEGVKYLIDIKFNKYK